MRALPGIPASPGIAIGPVRILNRPGDGGRAEKIAPSRVEEEIARFDQARREAMGEIRRLLEKKTPDSQGETEEIFQAHLEMLDDPMLIEGVETRIREGLLDAESAAAEATRDIAVRFDGMEDEYFRQRGADIRDIGVRIGRALTGERDSEAEAGFVAVADELLPSEAEALARMGAVGAATERGGPSSHAAILVRAAGIPYVAGVAGLLDAVWDGMRIAVDGERGEAILNPDGDAVQRLGRKADKLEKRRATLWSRRFEPAVTHDGRRVRVMANAGSADDVRVAVESGADGVGLFRTEFLFLNRPAAPSAAEQERAYRDALKAAGGKPVVFRLLDLGADKPAPYLDLAPEPNPSLGLRGVRLLLERVDVLERQVDALLKASDEGPMSVMVPMIVDAAEMDRVREILDRIRESLKRDGRSAPDVPLGAMIETPASALGAEALAKACDFFSVGTNDLTQYCLAADRMSPAVSRYLKDGHPAVMELVRLAAAGARAAGISIGVCGEAASDGRLIPELLRRGVDSLSVSPRLVPEVKEFVRESSVE